MDKVNITIVGGGIVGCALAYTLSRQYDNVLLLEKNIQRKQDIPEFTGENQTSRNAAVIHAGIYYDKRQNPLKAKLCVEGNRLMYDFCAEYNIPHKRVGKLLVATDGYGERMLDKQLVIAKENGVPDIGFLTSEEVKTIEPNVRCTKALYSKSTGIIDPVAAANKMSRLAYEDGAFVFGGHEVIDIKPQGTYFLVTARSKEDTFQFETRTLINSAGLYSDLIAKMANPESAHKIVPLKLEFTTFNMLKRPNLKVGMNIYPAPYYLRKHTGEIIKPSDAELERELGKTIAKTVGAHITPEITRGNSFSPEATISPVAAGACLPDDYKNTVKLQTFLDRVTNFFPNITIDDLAKTNYPNNEVGNRVGLLAEPSGTSDFIIEQDRKYPNLVNLIGIESPGMTSSLAIAEYVSDMIKN